MATRWIVLCCSPFALLLSCSGAPRDAGEYDKRGVSYLEQRLCEKAIEDFTRAIMLDPKYTKAYYDRGRAYSDNGQDELALDDFNKAIELTPTNAMAHYMKGLTCEKLGRTTETAVAYKRFLLYARQDHPLCEEVRRKVANLR